MIFKIIWTCYKIGYVLFALYTLGLICFEKESNKYLMIELDLEHLSSLLGRGLVSGIIVLATLIIAVVWPYCMFKDVVNFVKSFKS